MLTQFYQEQNFVASGMEVLFAYIKSRFIKYLKFSEGLPSNIFIYAKITHVQGILAVPIPLPDPFLNLRTNLLVSSLPKVLCRKLTENKSYLPCGI